MSVATRTHCPNCNTKYLPRTRQCDACGRKRDQRTPEEISAIVHAGNRATLQQFRENRDVVKGVATICSPDSCPVCKHENNKVYSIDAPPALPHYGCCCDAGYCRCSYVPITDTVYAAATKQRKTANVPPPVQQAPAGYHYPVPPPQPSWVDNPLPVLAGVGFLVVAVLAFPVPFLSLLMAGAFTIYMVMVSKEKRKGVSAFAWLASAVSVFSFVCGVTGQYKRFTDSVTAKQDIAVSEPSPVFATPSESYYSDTHTTQRIPTAIIFDGNGERYATPEEQVRVESDIRHSMIGDPYQGGGYSGGTQHVSGYTRRDGTHVSGYNRRRRK